ncbi:hypothetical protein ACHQM5_003691 [Ranunculus cassubicifolius]
MVIPMRASKFYGSTLPRPQFYTDIKYSQERVDPPLSILDPLLSWAQDAHWTMGGLSFKHVRHQGKIEGNLNKLRAEGEKRNKKNGVIAGKIEKLRAEKEIVVEKEKEMRGKVIKRGKIQKEVVAEKEQSPKKNEKVIEKKRKVGKVLKKRLASKAKGKEDQLVPAPVPVSPVVAEVDGGLRRSKRRKLVLRDEDDEEAEF